MHMLCLDVEGVLFSELWIKFTERPRIVGWSTRRSVSRGSCRTSPWRMDRRNCCGRLAGSSATPTTPSARS